RRRCRSPQVRPVLPAASACRPASSAPVSSCCLTALSWLLSFALWRFVHRVNGIGFDAGAELTPEGAYGRILFDGLLGLAVTLIVSTGIRLGRRFPVAVPAHFDTKLQFSAEMLAQRTLQTLLRLVRQ